MYTCRTKMRPLAGSQSADQKTTNAFIARIFFPNPLYPFPCSKLFLLIRRIVTLLVP